MPFTKEQLEIYVLRLSEDELARIWSGKVPVDFKADNGAKVVISPSDFDESVTPGIPIRYDGSVSVTNKAGVPGPLIPVQPSQEMKFVLQGDSLEWLQI